LTSWRVQNTHAEDKKKPQMIQIEKADCLMKNSLYREDLQTKLFQHITDLVLKMTDIFAS
jgi:hypothetical protein